MHDGFGLWLCARRLQKGHFVRPGTHLGTRIELTIYAEEPWTAHSQAIVCWSLPKGGLPVAAAVLRLVRLVEVRSAIRLLANEYDQPMFGDRLDQLCTLLIARVNELIPAGVPPP